MSENYCSKHQCEFESFSGFNKCAQCNWDQRPKPSLEDQIIALTDMYKTLSIQYAANHDHKVRQIDENRKISSKVDEIIDFDNSIKESMIQLNNRITAIVKDYNEMNMRRIEESTLISRRLTEIEKLSNFNMSPEVQELVNFNLKMINERLENLENPDADYLDDEITLIYARLKKIEKFHDEFKDVLKKDLTTHRKMWDEVYERLDRLEGMTITEDEMKNFIKTPHKCPVCNGCGTWELESLEEVSNNHGSKYLICKPCEGKGIVWG